MKSIDNTKVKVLLVDDTQANLEIAGRVLESEGYDLYISDSGFKAIEIIKDTDIDLILMDIMMPEMDGFETSKIIRQTEKNKGIPIIFITAKADIESVVKGFELGAVDYIRKPLNGMELKARVKTHVELKKIREELEYKNLKLEEVNNKLELAVITDPLTNLFNRRELLSRIEYEKVRYERNKLPFSVVICDIDYFKRINDTYGHSFGDTVLKSLADIFRNNSRAQDSVSRWGGEEFLMLLPDTDGKGAYILAEKLRQYVERSVFRFEETDVKLTVTFGISSYKSGKDIDDLIIEADNALYEGKRTGRNRVCLTVDN